MECSSAVGGVHTLQLQKSHPPILAQSLCFFSELVGRCVGEGSFQPGIYNRIHCLLPEAIMKELLGFELYSQLCSSLYSAQEESAVSVSVNQPRSQQLPLTLLGVLLCSIKKCSMKHKVPFLLLDMFLQCLTHPQKLNSLRAPPCSH